MPGCYLACQGVDLLKIDMLKHNLQLMHNLRLRTCTKSLDFGDPLAANVKRNAKRNDCQQTDGSRYCDPTS